MKAWKSWLGLTVLVIGAGSLLLILVGVNPIEGWIALIGRSLGNPYGLSRVIERTAIFTVTALAFLLPFKAGIWNIGVEGQLMIGVLAAYSIARVTGGFAGPFVLVFMFIAAVIGGMLWALIPALIRLRMAGKEILTTLMLNYVAIYVVRHFSNVVWKDEGYAFPITKLLPRTATFAGLPRSEIHTGIILTILILVLVIVFMRYFALGFDLRTHGGSLRTALFAGVDIRRVIMLSLLLGGAIAGIAGLIELSGGTPRLTDGVGLGLGYMGIPVALLANADPKKVPIAALFFAVLVVGSTGLNKLGVPAGVYEVLLGVAIMARLAFVGKEAAVVR